MNRPGPWVNLLSCLAMALTGSVHPLAAQAITGPQPGAGCAPRRPQLAVGQTLATNLVVNRVGAWLLDEKTQLVGFESWARNLRRGWEWDEGGFAMNMFAHPFHGAQYFNAGRTHCLTFWESIPLAFLGSWTWEYFGETTRPSLNDFFMTTFGGIALGEMTHRLAEAIRDDQAAGVDRISREILATIVNPVAGLNRLWRGEWARTGGGSGHTRPDPFDVRLKIAGRWVAQDTVGVCSFCPTLVMDVMYGDPLDQSFDKPFDVFGVRAQVSPDGGGLNVLEATGRLYQIDLNTVASRRRYALSVSQRYAYSSYTPVLTYGAQSIELGILSRVPLPRDWELHSRFHGNLLAMGAVNAARAGIGERNYDFGPGLGFGLELDFWRKGHRYISFRNRAEYLYTVSGVPSEHLITFSRLEAELPLDRRLGLGVAADLATRTSRYDTGEHETRDFADVRLFLSWALSR